MTRRLAAGLAVALLFTLASVAASQQTTVGAWMVTKTSDPITDADRSSIIVISGKSVFGFRCTADGLSSMMVLGRFFMGEDDRVQVVYRFPPHPAVGPHPWSLSTNNQAAFVPRGDIRTLITQGLANPSLIIRATDRDGDTVTGEFKLEGFAEALKHLPCYTPQEQA